MTLIIVLFVAPFTLLTIFFAVEVLVGLKPLQPHSLYVGETKAVVVTPAHNEELIIGATLGRLKEAAGSVPILVVADNCTDSTAAVARQIGVDVIERSDAEHRGKGFALDFAREHLKADPPTVVLIIDADCTTDARSISTLVAACAAKRRPCQATNLQKPSSKSSITVQLSTFAFFIKNVVRERALQRLAGRAHLLGTGMALPWEIFRAANLATSDIVEDLKLGLELSEAGYAPLFVEQACVWSNAETPTNTISQRRRWEGGFLRHAFKFGPAMLARALRAGDARGSWAAIDLMVPPFALLILLDTVCLAAAAALSVLLSAHLWPVVVLTAALIAAVGAVMLAWFAGGRRFIGLFTLIRAPVYVAWKLSMYVGLARRGAPQEWQRTGRG